MEMEKDLLDRIVDDGFFNNIEVELHKEGKNVIGHNSDVSEEFNFMIEPDKKAYLIRNEDSGLIKIRELTQEEYQLIGIERFYE